ncbi:A/G-specific adenine glycosylase [soil metagenome]
MEGAGPDAAQLATLLAAWFPDAARSLPWRLMPRDPYRALVSEAMLQQTQVARVVPAFERFIAAFPDIRALAQASEDRVLALWAGLGYYRRARHLHAAARTLVSDFAGVIPADAAALQTLAGVGRYTAGAISSIVFNRPAPIVDGNVTRVLLRVFGRDLDPCARATVAWTWERAAELAAAAWSPALTNEGLMELGALVCLPPPQTPRCDACPLAGACIARREGLTTVIPRPKPAGAQKDVFCIALLAVDRKNRVLIEQRGPSGMWSNMWQVPTLERADRWPTGAELREFATLRGVEIAAGTRTDRCKRAFVHQTTHRVVHFRVMGAMPGPCRTKARAGRMWCVPTELHNYAMSNAQRRILKEHAAPAPRGVAT